MFLWIYINCCPMTWTQLHTAGLDGLKRLKTKDAMISKCVNKGKM